MSVMRFQTSCPRLFFPSSPPVRSVQSPECLFLTCVWPRQGCQYLKVMRRPSLGTSLDDQARLTFRGNSGVQKIPITASLPRAGQPQTAPLQRPPTERSAPTSSFVLCRINTLGFWAAAGESSSDCMTHLIPAFLDMSLSFDPFR